MIEGIRKILSSDNIKEMACKYTGAEEEYQGFILGCNVLADEIEEIVKNCSIPNVSQQRELLFCGGCGNKKQLIVETDINSQRVCKNKLCKQNNCG